MQRSRSRPDSIGRSSGEPASTGDERPIWPLIVLRTPGLDGPRRRRAADEGSWRCTRCVATYGERHRACSRTAARYRRGAVDATVRPAETSRCAARRQPVRPIPSRKPWRDRRRARPERLRRARGAVRHPAIRKPRHPGLGGWCAVIRANHVVPIFGRTDRLDRLSRRVEATDRGGRRDPPDRRRLAPTGSVIDAVRPNARDGRGYTSPARTAFSTATSLHSKSSTRGNQHAKGLKMTREIAWRRTSRPELPPDEPRLAPDQRLSTRPGIIDHVVTRSRVSGVPPGPTRTRELAVADHCLRSTHYINVVVAASAAPNCLSIGRGIQPAGRLGAWKGRRRNRRAGRRPAAPVMSRRRGLAAAAILRAS